MVLSDFNEFSCVSQVKVLFNLLLFKSFGSITALKIIAYVLPIFGSTSIFMLLFLFVLSILDTTFNLKL